MLYWLKIFVNVPWILKELKGGKEQFWSELCVFMCSHLFCILSLFLLGCVFLYCILFCYTLLCCSLVPPLDQASAPGWCTLFWLSQCLEMFLSTCCRKIMTIMWLGWYFLSFYFFYFISDFLFFLYCCTVSRVKLAFCFIKPLADIY